MPPYPIFIPMVGLGGGGAPVEIIATLAAASGALIYSVMYMLKPNIHLEFKKTGTTAQLIYKASNILDIEQVKNYNIDALIAKGYVIKSIKTQKNALSMYEGNVASISKPDLCAMQFLTDCKECDVYSMVNYSYDPLLSYKISDKSKRLYWSACNVRRELM